MVVKRGVSQLGGFRTTGFEVFMRVGLKSSAKIQKKLEICKFWDTKMQEKRKKMQKLPMSDSIRHNGHRKRPAFNAGEIDEDKRDPGIAVHRNPEGRLCRHRELAPNVASTGH